MKATYTIDACNLENLKARILKISRKASKLGAAAITLSVITSYVVRREFTNDEGVKFSRSVPVLDITIDGETPRVPGYELLATIEHTGGGNIIREVPVMANDLEERGFRTIHGKIASYRESAADCDHCNVSRNRNDTFLIYEGSTGTVRQIGRTCLADFLGGANPHAMVALAEAYIDCTRAVQATSDAQEELSDLCEFLVYTAASIRLHGWISKGKCRDNQIPTATDAEACLWDWTGKHTNGKPTADDLELAFKALDYVKVDLEAKGSKRNSYQQNLWVIIQNGTVGPRHCGFAASIIPYYQRALEQQEERVDYAERAAKSKYVGQPKQRLTFTATVERKSHFEGRFGLTYIYKFRCSKGNALTWFASRSQGIEQGDVITLVGTVKKHDDYRGEAQTILTRCKVS